MNVSQKRKNKKAWHLGEFCYSDEVCRHFYRIRISQWPHWFLTSSVLVNNESNAFKSWKHWSRVSLHAQIVLDQSHISIHTRPGIIVITARLRLKKLPGIIIQPCSCGKVMSRGWCCISRKCVSNGSTWDTRTPVGKKHCSLDFLWNPPYCLFGLEMRRFIAHTNLTFSVKIQNTMGSSFSVSPVICPMCGPWGKRNE